MPTSGKLLSVGNHEIGGVIYYGDMDADLKRNHAVASNTWLGDRLDPT